MEAKRMLVLKMSVSLDGFVCGPNGENDWVFRSSSPDSRQWVTDTLREAGAHLMGSRTYYDMASFWPFSDLPFAPAMNEIPKILFSGQGKDDTRLDRVMGALANAQAGHNDEQSGPSEAVLRSWADPMVARGDLVDEIRRLKEQPGNFLLAHGGARFAQSLAASGLVDEYRLAIHPVVLGQGKPLFSELAKPVDLHLASVTTFSSGTVGAVYRPA
jgi:dihydrofolate reductase